METNILFIILVTFFAGMGAGLGTGFAGMSAAAVISPMLIAFLKMDPYMAVGIALSSDVLASAVSAYTYGKNKNLDIRNGLLMMVSVLIFTVIGSYAASLLPSSTMGSFSVFMTFILGVKFIVRPVMTTKEAMNNVSSKKRAIQSIICGTCIGFICGFVGAGGGGADPPHLLRHGAAQGGVCAHTQRGAAHSCPGHTLYLEYPPDARPQNPHRCGCLCSAQVGEVCGRTG